MNMTKNQKIIVYVLAGAAVAGGLVYILSNRGTNLRNEIRTRGRRLSGRMEDVVDKAKKRYQKTREGVL